MLRLFIALLLPDRMKDELGQLIDSLRPLAGGIKWVEPKNMHLTLKFLGDTPELKVDPIGDILASVLAGRKRFETALAGCGGFPNLKNPRVLWAGLSGADPAIEMARDIDKKLKPLGFERERKPLSPHLTLGRIRQPGDISAVTSKMEGLKLNPEPIILHRVALVKSTLTPRGPIYEQLKQIELE